jgi:hypothetical protein
VNVRCARQSRSASSAGSGAFRLGSCRSATGVEHDDQAVADGRVTWLAAVKAETPFTANGVSCESTG